MIRKLTAFWLSAACLAGTALFHTSQDVQDARIELRQVETEIAKEKDSIRVLQAEWNYLNRPERLEKLAKKHLDLERTPGERLVALSDLVLPAMPKPVETVENADTETPAAQHAVLTGAPDKETRDAPLVNVALPGRKPAAVKRALADRIVEKLAKIEPAAEPVETGYDAQAQQDFSALLQKLGEGEE